MKWNIPGEIRSRILKTKRRKRISFFSVSVLGCYLLFRFIILVSPVPEERIRGDQESIRIFDRHGELLREAANEQGASSRWVDLESISPFVIEAVITVEDKRFYAHHGVDVFAITRATGQAVKEQRVVSGASTISMQLARLAFGHSHSWKAKIAQAFNARRLERTLTKDEILTYYLNRVFLGANSVGIEAASQRYFSKPNMHLSRAEATLLAGLIQAPSRYNPLNNYEQAKERQEKILRLLYLNHTIDSAEYARSLAEPVILHPSNQTITGMHFTDYVLQQTSERGDIYTSLDKNLQLRIENLVKDHVNSFLAGGLTNASVVVIENATGRILAMVGSTDYWKGGDGAVNGALSLRQPGSALKPFTYALAFSYGKSPADIVPDIETEYQGGSGELYIPRNYSEVFHGPVMMKSALGRSLNVPAIRTLNFVGIDSLLMCLEKLGISSLTKPAGHYGLGLTLGNGEVSLLELAQVYAVFPRKGCSCRTGFLNDYVSGPGEQVFSEEITFLITDILSDEKLRIQAFGSATPLLFDFPIAIKTGTSANFRDNWVMGYTEQYTIAVWAGDFSGEPMNQFSGSVGAGPLFNKVANLVIRYDPSAPLPGQPDLIAGIQQIMVCPISGKPPSQLCPNQEVINILAEDIPDEACDVHQLLRIDTRNGLRASESCPSRFTTLKMFEVLPAEYGQWQADNGREVPPTRYSPYCMPDRITVNALVITSPPDGDIYLIEPGYNMNTQSIALKGEVDPPVPYIDWYINNQRYERVEWPYQANFTLRKGKHTIEMRAGNRKSDAIRIEVR